MMAITTSSMSVKPLDIFIVLDLDYEAFVAPKEVVLSFFRLAFSIKQNRYY